MGAKYFSVKYTTTMLGTRYIPSVCYKMDTILEETIKQLAKRGDARIYDQKVRFVSGVAIPVAKERLFSSAPAQGKPFTRKSKKGREFD